MKVVSGVSPIHSKVSPQQDDIFGGCYSKNETRSYSICGDNPRLLMKEYCGNSSNFGKEISRSKSLLREADNHIDLLNSSRLTAQDASAPNHLETLATPDSLEGCNSSTQSNSPARLLCPISFQPFIAFQGLYATTSCEMYATTTSYQVDNLIAVEASQRSPTGLIAPPYLPPNSGNMETELIAAEDDNRLNCNESLDNAESGSIISQSTKLSEDNNDSSRLPPQSERKDASFSGTSFILDKTQGVTRGHNHSVHPTVAGIESLSDQNCYHDRGLRPLSSDYSDHRDASPLIKINDKDDFDNTCLFFARRDTTRADHTSNLLMPCGKGVPLDLLANSLHTVAQHSRSIETDHPVLNGSTHASHPSPKQISLTLPFKELATFGNKLYETPDCGTTAEIGDDGSSNIGLSLTRAERNHGYHDNLQSSHSFEMGLRSTLNTDAEISPMSPPSYFSYSDLYCQQNVLPELGGAMLPTIFEGPHKSDLLDKNLVTPYPLCQFEHSSPGEVSSTLESLGSRAKRSRRILDSENNVSKYVLNEPIVYSKGRIIIGDSRLGKGRSQYKPNSPAVVIGNSPNMVDIKKSMASPRKLGKKSTHSSKNKKEKFTHPSQTLGNLLIAGAGVLMSQLSINKILLQVTPWVTLALSVTMRSASVVVILAIILVLDQRKRTR
jgi:hypothetical protein